jgi:hypothetical protein
MFLEDTSTGKVCQTGFDELRKSAKRQLKNLDYAGAKATLKAAVKSQFFSCDFSGLRLNSKLGKAAVLEQLSVFIDAQLVTRSTVLARGWKESALDSVYGDADVSVKNPHYRSGAPMRLYVLHRVEALELVHGDALMRKRKSKKECKPSKPALTGADYWRSWVGDSESVDIALAELIRYVNRYIKTFPRYKHQTNGQRALVEAGYAVKDSWIRRNKDKCVGSCKSLEETHTWFEYDYEYSDDYDDYDDYDEGRKRSETVRFYAYTFNIDGREYRFHSKVCLFEKDRKSKVNADAMGSAIPLSTSEMVIKLKDAIAAAKFALDLEPICQAA